MPEQRRHRHPGEQPRTDPDQRGQRDLQPEDARDVAAGRAQHLERGDAGAAALEPRVDPVADADPGDRQRGQRDEHEELAHPPDEPLEARRGAVAVANFQSGIGEAFFQAGDRGGGIGPGGQTDAGLAADHGARLDQLAGGERLAADDHHRAEGEAFAQPVGLVADDPARRSASPRPA